MAGDPTHPRASSGRRPLVDDGVHLPEPGAFVDPSRILKNARSLVVGAWPIEVGVGERPTPTSARVARYATEDHYARLESALTEMADVLRGRGHRAVVMADDNSVVDREAAWRAGIGFYGKNANILLPGRGSHFVLGSVVTDAPLPPSTPGRPDECGSCRACLDRCPTGAIVADGVVDARRCLAWLVQQPGLYPTEFREALGDRIYGCDDCQEACPPSRRHERARDPNAGELGGCCRCLAGRRRRAARPVRALVSPRSRSGDHSSQRLHRVGQSRPGAGIGGCWGAGERSGARHHEGRA